MSVRWSRTPFSDERAIAVAVWDGEHALGSGTDGADELRELRAV